MTKTDHDRIFIEKDKPVDRAEVSEMLGILSKALEQTAGTMDQKPVVEALKKAVPTFRDPDMVNSSVDAERELEQC